MLPPKQAKSPDQRELLSLFRRLDPGQRKSLLDFARFLAQQGREDSPQPAPEPPSEPLGIPRPSEESVVAAIRRLSRNYPMLNKDELFHSASSLMTAHVMHGRSAPEVIDELEALFGDSYRRYLERRQQE